MNGFKTASDELYHKIENLTRKNSGSCAPIGHTHILTGQPMHKDFRKRHLENLLTALLQHFLGTMKSLSRSAYENGHEMAGHDFDKLGSRRFRGHRFKIPWTFWTVSKL